MSRSLALSGHLAYDVPRTNATAIQFGLLSLARCQYRR
jgi:hypothetical protein